MSIAESQRDFYENLLDQFGNDPRSLSHRDQETQYERFYRIARVFEGYDGDFTVHEIGCGLGHFGDYLRAAHPGAIYSGSEICPQMVEHARRDFPGAVFYLRDISDPAFVPDTTEKYDFVTVSGTFNCRQQVTTAEWSAFICCMLKAAYAMATRGIVVNFLTPYSDAAYRRSNLHYQDITELLDFVVANLSRHVEIDAAGPLYEYTVRIYRPHYVRSAYSQPTFDRYFRNSTAAAA